MGKSRTRTHELWWTVAALGIAATIAACAAGADIPDKSDDDGDDDGTGGAGGTGTTAASMTTTMMSTGSLTVPPTTTATTSSSSSSSSSASSTSSGMACDEVPCKLVEPQCGCDPGEQCSLDASLDPACIAEGTVPVGQQCDLGQECAPGGLCVLTKATAPTVSTCGEFCDTDAECTAPGGLCIIGLNDGSGGTVPNVTFCTENCNPITNSGCPVVGTSCTIGQLTTGGMQVFSRCLGAGSGGHMAACAGDSQNCLPGFGCFTTTTDVCLKWCDINAPNCPVGTCQDVGLQLGTISYGACL